MVREASTDDGPASDPVVLTRKGIVRGVLRLAPISIFVIPFGVGFGVAAIDQGLSSVQAIVMSALVFSGAAQFASLEFWPDPANFLSIALVMCAVNARHIITGAALSPWLNQLPIRTRWSALAMLSDPNFSDSQPAFRAGERDVGILLGGGLILWINWVGGTALGALAGETVGDMRVYGLDVVMVCFFAAAMTGRLNERSALIPALIAAAIAVTTLSVLPAGWNIVMAALAGGVWGAFARGD